MKSVKIIITTQDEQDEKVTQVEKAERVDQAIAVQATQLEPATRAAGIAGDAEPAAEEEEEPQEHDGFSADIIAEKVGAVVWPQYHKMLREYVGERCTTKDLLGVITDLDLLIRSDTENLEERVYDLRAKLESAEDELEFLTEDRERLRNIANAVVILYKQNPAAPGSTLGPDAFKSLLSLLEQHRRPL